MSNSSNNPVRFADVNLPESARANYLAALSEMERWLDADKLEEPSARTKERQRTAGIFQRYIQEAIDDVKNGLTRLPEEDEIHVAKLLTYLDDQLGYERIGELYDAIVKFWPTFSLKLRMAYVVFLSDSLYELQREQQSARQHAVFGFLRDQAGPSSERELRAHVILALIVHASGLTEEGVQILVEFLEEKETSAFIAAHAVDHPSLGRIWTELRGQYSILRAFTAVPSPDNNILDVPPIVSIFSRKGGVGKTTLALALALRFAKTKRVCLLDLDLVGPSLSYFFNFKDRASIPTLETVLGDVKDTGIDGLFQIPQNIIPGIQFPENLRVAQASSLAAPRHDLYSRLFCGQLQLVRNRFREILSSLKDSADLVIIDNAPGLFGLSLVTFGFTFYSGGLTLLLSSADIHDVGALQIELDLFKNVGVFNEQSRAFRWVCNKVPNEVSEIYKHPERLQYHLRNHPALDDVPGFMRERLLRRYSLPLPQPITITACANMGLTYAVTGNGNNISFSDLVDGPFAKDPGFDEICTTVNALIENDKRRSIRADQS